jgi:uncharacterized membrane protein
MSSKLSTIFKGGETVLKKSLITVVVICAALAGIAFADDVPGQMEFPANNGAVAFNHLKHVNEVQRDCSVCHNGTPGLIEGFIGKDYPHELCLGCHTKPENSSAPTTCNGCHNQQ